MIKHSAVPPAQHRAASVKVRSMACSLVIHLTQIAAEAGRIAKGLADRATYHLADLTAYHRV